jgi:peroxiredoxin
MVETASTMKLELGSDAPKFALKDAGWKRVSLDDFKGAKAYLIIFMCNHCPFVKHILNKLVEVGNEYAAKGVAVAAINSNDAENFPDDAPDQMRRLVREKGFKFPYLYDETQQVAKAYRAACTPDFFLFDADRKLVYRGQFDGSRPGNGIPVTGEDLKRALDCVLAGEEVPALQRPSLGCSIKWIEGNEPHYADE